MLCEVAPVPSAHCPTGSWSQRATQRFVELTANRKLAAKVWYIQANAAINMSWFPEITVLNLLCK